MSDSQLLSIISALKQQNTALNAVVYGLMIRMSAVDPQWRDVVSGAFDEAEEYVNGLLDHDPESSNFQKSLDMVKTLRGATIGEIQKRHGV